MNNNEELEMLYLALKDTDHGLLLFHSDVKDQELIVDKIKKRFDDAVSIRNGSLLNINNKLLKIDFFKLWLKQEPDHKIYLLYNLQALPSSKNKMEFYHTMNLLRDELVDLNCIFLFGMSKYFAVELAQNAPDLYSFFSYHANFESRENNMLSLNDNLNIHVGDVISERERLLKLYREIKKHGIENYKISDRTVRYLSNFLLSWNDIHDYLSSDIDFFVLEVVDKICTRINDLSDYNMNMVGEIYYNLGYYDKALKIYQKLLNSNKYFFKSNDFCLEKMYSKIGNVYLKQKKYDQAIINIEESLKIIRNKLSDQDILIAENYNTLAIIYSNQQNYQKALGCLDYAFKIIEKTGSNKPFSMIVLYNNLGLIHLKSEKYELAIEIFDRALQLAKMYLSKMHLMIATIYNNLAFTYQNLGKNQEAIINYQKALKINEEILGKEHPSTKNNYNNLKLLTNDD